MGVLKVKEPQLQLSIKPTMQTTVEQPKPKFNPVTLTLKFESENELKAFKDLMGHEMTIPEVLIQRECIDQEKALTMERMMRSIFRNLVQNTL